MARATSLLGTWLNTLAIVHLLGEGQTTAALPLALVFVLKQLPATFLGAAAGVVADRFDRRRVMIVCDVLQAGAVLSFLFVEPGGSHLLIYSLTFMQVCIGAFFDPAYHAVIPDIVRDDDLVAANAIGAATWSAMFAVGTALGGLVLYLWGWKAAIALDALSYVLSGALIASVRDARTKPPRRAPERPSVASLLGITDMRDGLAYLRAQPGVRRMLLAKTAWGSMGAATLFLTLLGATPSFRLLDSGDLGISYLWFCRALGTGIGPLLARSYARNDPRRLHGCIVAGFVLAIGFYALLGAVYDPWLAAPLVIGAHVGGSTIWVVSTILLQQRVPSQFRGRTFATDLGLVMLTSSLSYLIWGAVLDYSDLGLRAAIPLAAAVAALPAVSWVVAASPRPRRQRASGR